LELKSKDLNHYKCIYCNGDNISDNVQIRLPEEEYTELDALAKLFHSSRSETARNALHEGVRVLKMDLARKKFLANEFSLSKAAEFASVSLQEMSEFLSKGGIPYFRYSVEELEADMKRAKTAIKNG
jgi:predicted HTH domain antitoxin